MIGWYVHHHGAGHLQRFLAARRLLPQAVGLSSLPRPAGLAPEEWIELPLDVPAGEPDDPTAGGALHWAPLRCDGLRSRTAAIAAWVERTRPAALVVDVSVEVALLGRLLGVPTVVVAQRGVRRDPPHQLAFASAAAVVAPWTAATDLPGCGLPPETIFTGAISRFDWIAPRRPPAREVPPRPAPAGDAARPAPAREVPPRPAPAADARPRAASAGDVLLLVGSGGHAVRAGDVLAAVAATPERRWHVAGPLRVRHPRVVDHGERADVATLLRDCGVVVATAGGNAVAEVAALRRPLVVLPQERPFEEQRLQAEALRRADLAEVALAWPAAEAWPALLERAEQRDPGRWELLHDGRGAERLAAAVTAVAAGRRVVPDRLPAAA